MPDPEDDREPEGDPSTSILDSPWTRLRWLPAGFLVLFGINLIAFTAMVSLRLAGRFRSEGWNALRADPAAAMTPGLTLLLVVAGLAAMGFAGLSGLVAARAWVNQRWWSALAFTALGPAWFLVGAFLLGWSQSPL